MNSDFGESMAQTWCDRHGWADLSRQGLTWWAFEGRDVMPKPLPDEAQTISNAIRGIGRLSLTINSFAQAVGQVTQAMAAMPTIPARSITFSGIADQIMNSDFGESMAQAWCDRNDWSDPTRQGLIWWAFEGRSVMPKPLPTEAQPISNAIRGINRLSATINSFAQTVDQVAGDMAAMSTIPIRSITFSGIADHADPIADIRAAMTRIGSGVTLSPEGRERLRVTFGG